MDSRSSIFFCGYRWETQELIHLATLLLSLHLGMCMEVFYVVELHDQLICILRCTYLYLVRRRTYSEFLPSQFSCSSRQFYELTWTLKRIHHEQAYTLANVVTLYWRVLLRIIFLKSFFELRIKQQHPGFHYSQKCAPNLLLRLLIFSNFFAAHMQWDLMLRLMASYPLQLVNNLYLHFHRLLHSQQKNTIFPL